MSAHVCLTLVRNNPGSLIRLSAVCKVVLTDAARLYRSLLLHLSLQLVWVAYPCRLA
jgi:hypothetical protein